LIGSTVSLSNQQSGWTPAATPDFTYASPADAPAKQWLIRLIERLSGQPRLFQLYRAYQREPEPRQEFWSAAVRALELKLRLDQGDLSLIPSQGPAVVVANHPFGVLDGIVLASLVGTRRKDFRLLVHSLLTSAQEPRPWLLPIDFTAAQDARRANIASRNAARTWLEAGGALIIFPGGTVSTAPTLFAPAVDPDWQPFVAALVARSGAPVVPVYFEGENSRLFQLASHVSQTLRLALLFHEVARRIGSEVHVRIGEPLPADELARIGDRRALAAHLRQVTYALGGRHDTAPSAKLAAIALSRVRARPMPK
jgi:putative hemolysin